MALDQRTGEALWSVEVAPWQEGYSFTAAPLYYGGMVITGVSGGVMGVRCHISAYDATTGELGHNTWPADNRFPGHSFCR